MKPHIDVSGCEDIILLSFVNTDFAQRFVSLFGSVTLSDGGFSVRQTSMRNAAGKQPPPRSHPWLDLVDLAMHRAIARKIRGNPKLYRRARLTLAHWEKVKRACPPALREWKQILRNNDMNTVLRIITRPDEEGHRLRSVAPFCGILTKREVRAIWAQYD